MSKPAISLSVAAAIVGVALAAGGFGPAALGAGTLVVWIGIAALALGGRVAFGNLTGSLMALVALLVLLAAWTATSTAWAGDDGAAFTDLVRILLYLGVVLAVGLTARPGSGSAWLAGIAGGGTAVAILALASVTLGIGSDGGLALELPLAAERLSYPIGYWNALGYLMAMTLPALAWLSAAGRASLPRAAVAASVPVVVALFLTSSRGALLAAAVGLVFVIVFLPERPRLALPGAVAAVAWTIAVVAAAGHRAAVEAGSGFTAWGAALALVVVGAAIAAYVAVGRLEGRAALRAAFPRWRNRYLPAVLVIPVAAMILVGPSSFVGEFRTESAVGEQDVASALVSGSGRSSFWGAGLDAFADDPWRGTGAGGFRNYWNINGDLDVPVANVHSAPLETFGELGLVGGLAYLGLFGAAIAGAVRLLRAGSGAARGQVGAVLGVLAAGIVATSIDWTWELPAALLPMIIALALLTGAALRRPGSVGSLLIDERVAGYERADSPPRPAPWVIGLGLAALGAVSMWAGVVIAASGIQMDRSADRLAAGDLQGAAEAARSAADIQPWSLEPSLRLAEVEVVGANYEAARRRAEESARISPADFRPWLLLSEIHAALGNAEQAGAYEIRATMLGPRVLARGGGRPAVR